jgi:hypothetical protein
MLHYHSHQSIIDAEIAADEQQDKRLEAEYLQTQKVAL